MTTPSPSNHVITWVKNVTKVKKGEVACMPYALVVDEKTGNLYVSKGLDLYAVTDPYTGDQVQVEDWVWSLHPDNILTPIHIDLDNPDSLRYRDSGVELELRPVTIKGWAEALIESALDLPPSLTPTTPLS